MMPRVTAEMIGQCVPPGPQLPYLRGRQCSSYDPDVPSELIPFRPTFSDRTVLTCFRCDELEVVGEPFPRRSSPAQRPAQISDVLVGRSNLSRRPENEEQHRQELSERQELAPLVLHNREDAGEVQVGHQGPVVLQRELRVAQVVVGQVVVELRVGRRGREARVVVEREREDGSEGRRKIPPEARNPGDNEENLGQRRGPLRRKNTKRQKDRQRQCQKTPALLPRLIYSFMKT